MDHLQKQKGTFSILHQTLCIISNPSVNSNWIAVWKRSIQVKIADFLCDLEIWWMILENNRAPLLHYVKLCASFQIHLWIQTGVTVRKLSIWVKIGNFLSRVTLKLDRWLGKTIGHLFYAASSFEHHFKVIMKFKLELQSRNSKFRSKLAFFFPCHLEIWWMTMKNYRHPLLYYAKLCASFQSHQRIQTGGTVQKCPIWIKISTCLSPVTFELNGWPWKTIGHPFYAMLS